MTAPAAAVVIRKWSHQVGECLITLPINPTSLGSLFSRNLAVPSLGTAAGAVTEHADMFEDARELRRLRQSLSGVQPVGQEGVSKYYDAAGALVTGRNLVICDSLAITNVKSCKAVDGTPADFVKEDPMLASRRYYGVTF